MQFLATTLWVMHTTERDEKRGENQDTINSRAIDRRCYNKQELYF